MDRCPSGDVSSLKDQRQERTLFIIGVWNTLAPTFSDRGKKFIRSESLMSTNVPSTDKVSLLKPRKWLIYYTILYRS